MNEFLSDEKYPDQMYNIPCFAHFYRDIAGDKVDYELRCILKHEKVFKIVVGRGYAFKNKKELKHSLFDLEQEHRITFFAGGSRELKYYDAEPSMKNINKRYGKLLANDPDLDNEGVIFIFAA